MSLLHEMPGLLFPPVTAGKSFSLLLLSPLSFFVHLVCLSTWYQWFEIISHRPSVHHLVQQDLVSVRTLYTSKTQPINSTREYICIHNTEQVRERAVLQISLLKGPHQWSLSFSTVFIGLESGSSVMHRNVWSPAYTEITLRCTENQIFSYHTTHIIFSRTCGLAKWSLA